MDKKALFLHVLISGTIFAAGALYWWIFRWPERPSIFSIVVFGWIYAMFSIGQIRKMRNDDH